MVIQVDMTDEGETLIRLLLPSVSSEAEEVKILQSILGYVIYGQ